MTTHIIATNIPMTYDGTTAIYGSTYHYSYFDPNLVTGRVKKIGWRTDLRRFPNATSTTYTSMGTASNVTYRFRYDDNSVSGWWGGTYSNYVYYTNEIPDNVIMVEFQFYYYVQGIERYRTYGWISSLETTVEGLDTLVSGSSLSSGVMAVYKNIKGPMNHLILPRTAMNDKTFRLIEAGSGSSANLVPITEPYLFKTEDTSLIGRYVRGTVNQSSAKDFFYVLLVPYVEPVKEPIIEERTVDSSIKSVSGSITKAYEAVKAASVKAIESEAVIEVQKINYSHVEPLRMAAVKHALVVTSTKGNKISTIAFTNVKTVSSSFIRPLSSSVKADVVKVPVEEPVVLKNYAVYMHAYPTLYRAESTALERYRKFYPNIEGVGRVRQLKFRSRHITDLRTDKYAYQTISNEQGKGTTVRIYYADGSHETVDLNYVDNYTTVSIPLKAEYVEFETLNNDPAIGEIRYRTEAIIETISFDSKDRVIFFKNSSTEYGKYSTIFGNKIMPGGMKYRIRELKSFADNEFSFPYSVSYGNSTSYAPSEFIDLKGIDESVMTQVYLRNYAGPDKLYYNVHINYAIFLEPVPTVETRTVDSHVKQIHSKAAVPKNSEATVNSVIASVNAKAAITPVLHSESVFEPFGSKAIVHSEAVPNSFVRAIDHTMDVTTYMTPPETVEATICSSTRRIASKVVTETYKKPPEVIEATVYSSVGKMASAVMMESYKKPPETIEVVVSSFARMIDSYAATEMYKKPSELIEASVSSVVGIIVSEVTTDSYKKPPELIEVAVDSYSEVITAEVSAATFLAPRSEPFEVIVSSFIRPVLTGAQRSSEKTLSVDSSALKAATSATRSLQPTRTTESHSQQGFSKALLGSLNVAVNSTMSNITSGVAARQKRGPLAFVATVDSTVRPIRHDILEERRKLKMRLNELKLRLRIPPEETANDELLLIFLDDAIDFVQRTCNQTFDPMPPTAKKVITQYTAFELNGNGYVLSESIAGMSQSFESSEQRDKSLTAILRKAGLIKLRFI